MQPLCIRSRETPWNHGQDVIDLPAELQKIYDSEINVEVSWLWDGGIEVRLGDRV